MSKYDEIIASSPRAFQIILAEMLWISFAAYCLLRERIAKDDFQLWWMDIKTSCSGVTKVLVCIPIAFVVVSIGYQIFDRVHIESMYLIFPYLHIIKFLLPDVSIDLVKIGTVYISFAPPLYYFYFKEQRAVSESYMTDVDVPIFNIFTICCLGSGLLFLDDKNKIDTVFDLIYLTILVVWVFMFLRGLMYRLRPRLLMQKAEREAEECLRIILAVGNDEIQIGNHEKVLYRRLNLAFEIYYQILAYGIQKNIHAIISDGIDSLETPFGLLKEIIKAKAEDISPKDPIYSTFRLILRNHKNFCLSLYEDKRNIEFQSAVRLFFKYYPHGLDLKDDENNLLIIDEFFKTYWSMLLYFINKDRNMFHSIANEILIINKLDNEATDIVLTLRALIINAVDEDSLKHIVEICYLQKKLINDMSYSEKSAKKNDFFSRVDSNSKKKRSQNYEGMQLYVLFQAMIKSTELSQYKMVGFLVKYVVSNYSPNIINKVYENVLHNKGYIDPRLHVEEFFKRLDVKFNINRATVVYCLKKVVILLRLQEMYFQMTPTSQKEVITLEIFEKNKDKFGFQYCLDKILSVKDQYGMISLNDENMISKLRCNYV